MSSKAMVLCIAAAVAVPAAGNAFLKATPTEKQFVAARAIEETLLTELALMGRDEHLKALQEQLRPMYAALPKNAEGKLDAAVVRYGLHRFFVQSRGWYVQGLQPSGDTWGASSPAELVKDRVPGFIQTLLEKRVHGHGLDLEDLAAFAATIQDLVHSEAVQGLMESFSLLRLPLEQRITETQLSDAIEVYLMSYILGTNLTTLGTSQAAALRSDVVEVYPAWPDVHMWAQDLQRTVQERELLSRPFPTAGVDFERASAMVQEVGFHFGAFQDQECRTMKDMLIDLEYRGTGRVRLADFHRNGLDGNWQFSESQDYLRAMGALDESDPRSPSVIIANYVGSQSNCLASSSFYSVCCMDECEGLMSQLENAIGEPTAEPAHIAHLVSGMSSDTVDAPRDLSPALLRRLDQIAEHHGGRVPLHGRLFAQFMHHAYPRECPFPHTSGTTNPMTPDEWMAKHGDAAVSEAEIAQVISANMSLSASGHSLSKDMHELLPWTSSEELVAVHEPTRTAGGVSLATVGFKFALLGAFGSLIWHRAKAVDSHNKVQDDKMARYLV